MQRRLSHSVSHFHQLGTAARLTTTGIAGSLIDIRRATAREAAHTERNDARAAAEVCGLRRKITQRLRQACTSRLALRPCARVTAKGGGGFQSAALRTTRAAHMANPYFPAAGATDGPAAHAPASSVPSLVASSSVSPICVRSVTSAARARRRRLLCLAVRLGRSSRACTSHGNTERSSRTSPARMSTGSTDFGSLAIVVGRSLERPPASWLRPPGMLTGRQGRHCRRGMPLIEIPPQSRSASARRLGSSRVPRE